MGSSAVPGCRATAGWPRTPTHRARVDRDAGASTAFGSVVACPRSGGRQDQGRRAASAEVGHAAGRVRDPEGPGPSGAGLRLRRWWLAVAASLLAACASPAPMPALTAVPEAVSGPTPAATSRPEPAATASAAVASPAAPAEPDGLLGHDGRLTVLLLGSDYRPSHPGNRTDAIMVVSVDPGTGDTAVVSIPRDTARFPLPDGSVYRPKVNGLYQSYVAQLGRSKAGKEIKRTIGGALGVEIDHYVLVGFEGVRQLVDAVGGVDVVLERTVRDPHYWVTARQRGVTFLAGANHLDGDRALIFARTRRGDNDYERARRQQLLVAAAVAKVRSAGLSAVPELLEIARRFVRTDLPLAEVGRIFEIVALADLETSRRKVLGPRTYADGIPGTASIQLKLDVVRALIAQWMPPVAGSPPQGSPPPGSPPP